MRKMNEQKGDLSPISLYPQEKQGLSLVFPSVHQLTPLLCWKPSNGFPLHSEKKSKLLPVTGKVPPAPVPAPSPASLSTALPRFVLRGPRSPPLVPRTGSAHPHFPAFAFATSSRAGSIPSPRPLFTCQLLRAQRDLPRPSYVETSQSSSLSYCGFTVLRWSIHTHPK